MQIVRKPFHCPIQKANVILEKETHFLGSGHPPAVLRLVCMAEPNCNALNRCPIREVAERICS